jgi:chitinase
MLLSVTKDLLLTCPPATLIAVIGAVFACLMMSGADARAEAPRPHGKRVVGYFTEWGGAHGYHASDIPAERLTHVNYAFAAIRDGECVVRDASAAIERVYPGDEGAGPGAIPFHGHFRQLLRLKQKHPHLRTLLSVGGWGGSELFSDAALTEASRAKFARSCVALAGNYGFDGVDIDWEYPAYQIEQGKGRREDTRNFTLLLAELRRQLDERGRADGKQYLLTIAAPAGPQNYRNLELDRIHPLLDWINLMCYDFAGPWNKLTGFNAPLYAPDPTAPGDETNALRLSADDAVRAYREAGVPAEKIVLGVPFYGRAFGGVADEHHGLFQPHDGKHPPAPDGARNWTWRVIAERYLAQRGVRRHWHDSAKVPWLYDATARVMISYDDPESLRDKARYARDQNLGGVMIWELSQDDERSRLLSALTDLPRE